MVYTLPWYQEIMLRHTVKMFGTNVLTEAIKRESMTLTDPNHDKLAFVLCGGSSVYNMLIERCRQRQVKASLMNHGIKEKFRWRWEKQRSQPYLHNNSRKIISRSEKWYDTREEAEKAGRDFKMQQFQRKVDDYSIGSDVEMKIESCCECTYNIPTRSRGICMCAIKWKKQNKTVLHEGESYVLPELFNYSSIDDDTIIP